MNDLNFLYKEYQKNGFAFPIKVIDSNNANKYRIKLEDAEKNVGALHYKSNLSSMCCSWTCTNDVIGVGRESSNPCPMILVHLAVNADTILCSWSEPEPLSIEMAVIPVASVAFSGRAAHQGLCE